ncbi:hypothetical protein AOQ84DRAFT_353022 [Glonium stellatum]|uniref:Ubiquinol-cytochrome c chaperone domain-containing protein n=1 Tax=Glonium stellatum TaxID=574774 RepID=A0A8E2F7P8_9PEZI|nr:hypothetical protein AOQ84DRAFT_353022 [Glonium stellatum]
MALNYTCRVCFGTINRRSGIFRLTGGLSHKHSICALAHPSRSFVSTTQYPSRLDLRAGSSRTPNAATHSSPVAENSSTVSPVSESVSSGQSPLPASTTARLAQELRKRASGTTETYVAYGATEHLFKECSRHANYSILQALEKGGVAPKNEAGEDVGEGKGWWYEGIALTPTFNTWAQITFIYMYMLTVRFRLFPAAHAPSWHQHLLDHFFHDAEDRMAMYHGMVARGVRNKYLKDLYIQWRGVLAAYDEGLVKGDAVLATAVWRNVFKGSQDADVRALAEIVGFMRKELKRLEEASDGEVASGDWKFRGDPGKERAVVMLESQLMKEKL